MPLRREAPVAERLRATLSPSRPLKAYQLTQILGEQMQRRSYANTVYRVMAALVASGEAVPLASVKAWLRAAPGERAPVILLCRECQCAVQVEGDEVAQRLHRICDKNAFVPARTYAEVVGLCGECRDGKAGPAAP